MITRSAHSMFSFNEMLNRSEHRTKLLSGSINQGVKIVCEISTKPQMDRVQRHSPGEGFRGGAPGNSLVLATFKDQISIWRPHYFSQDFLKIIFLFFFFSRMWFFSGSDAPTLPWILKPCNRYSVSTFISQLIYMVVPFDNCSTQNKLLHSNVQLLSSFLIWKEKKEKKRDRNRNLMETNDFNNTYIKYHPDNDFVDRA